MKAVKQFAIVKVVSNIQGFGGAKELSLMPQSEQENAGKLAVFPSEEDAIQEIERLLMPFSGSKYMVVPVYTDSKSI